MLQYKKMCIYRNAEDTEGKPVTLEYVVNRIMYGGSYRAVTFSGIFPPGQRRAAAIESHTGLVALHLKSLAVKAIPEFIKRLQRLSGVVLAFRPPRAVALLSCVLHVDPVPRDAAEHARAFQAVKVHVRYLTPWYRFKINDSGSDCSDLSYITQDFHHVKNYNAIPVTWEREAPQEIQHQASISNSDEIEGLCPEDLTAAHSIQDSNACWVALMNPRANTGIKRVAKHTSKPRQPRSQLGSRR